MTRREVAKTRDASPSQPTTGQLTPLDLPARTRKPRTYGLTAISDKGVPVAELRAVLADYHELLDVAKLGLGTAYFTPNLADKTRLYREYGIVPYFGGTLFEKHFQQGKVAAYLEFLRSHEIDWIEISTGSVDIPLEARVRLVERLSGDLVVLSEVGYKDPYREFRPREWIAETRALLEAGSRYVILEGRDSGTSGIYDDEGKARTGLLDEILRHVNPHRLIFEAPSPHGRAHCINSVGCNVNLGNISPRDLLVLECERHGLRFDTLDAQG